MAIVAKWLTHRIVVPALVSSITISRPIIFLGYSQAGKATDFDSIVMPGWNPGTPQPLFIIFEPVTLQLVEHLTFNQRVEGSSPSWLIILSGVAELADALDLGSSAARREGSTPFTRTKAFCGSS